MKEIDIEEELSKILKEEINNEILSSIAEGEVHVTPKGYTIFGKMSDDEKEFWGLNN